MEEKNIKVIDGYTPIQNVRYMTTYSYPVSSTVRIKNSSHYTLNVADDIVFSTGNPISLKRCDMVMSEIKNWGEFTAYTSINVLDNAGISISIRPIAYGDETILSASYPDGTEKSICSYGSVNGESLSFAINVGSLNYYPEIKKYKASCSIYAIKDRSGTGLDGVGSLTIQFDTVLSSYQNRLYTVSKTSTRRKL